MCFFADIFSFKNIKQASPMDIMIIFCKGTFKLKAVVSLSPLSKDFFNCAELGFYLRLIFYFSQVLTAFQTFLRPIFSTLLILDQ